MDPKKVVVTVAVNGVLTDPKKFKIPVTAEEVGISTEGAYRAGASVVHVHFRDQRPGMGHLPSWDPEVARAVGYCIKRRCPDIIINMTTGTIGSDGPLGGAPLGPTAGPIACLDAMLPDMAAMNAGSLNYLKANSDGTWAWPPMLFDNPVPKVKTMIDAMTERNIIPECECFDSGIVRSISMYQKVGMLKKPFQVSLVMGVASGMPAKPEWLPLLVNELPPQTNWQVIAIGRKEVWPLLNRCLQMGGNVRTGLEDTFYLPDGKKANSNEELIASLVKLVRENGKEPCTTAESRTIFGLSEDRKPKSILTSSKI
jgi:uncharacterized protein (DUF849 family)